MEAHISIILNLFICGNYCQISITNLLLYRYSKSIAIKLTSILPANIHLDQASFTPGQEARDNTLKTLTLLEYVQKHSIPPCLYIGAEKVFDRVGWCFLEEAIKQLGLSPSLLQKIMALYYKPSASVRMDGMLSNSI